MQHPGTSFKVHDGVTTVSGFDQSCFKGVFESRRTPISHCHRLAHDLPRHLLFPYVSAFVQMF